MKRCTPLLRGKFDITGADVSALKARTMVFAPFEAADPGTSSDKAALLKSLGLDPMAPMPMRTTSLRPATLPTGGLATTTEAALERINASPYVKAPLAADDVHVHTIEAGSSRFIPDRHAFLSESTLRNAVADAESGFSFMTKHNTAGWRGPGENPYGRTFAAQFEERDGFKRVLIQFYMLRGHTPNGQNAASTDDLNKGLIGGTLFDFSLGPKPGFGYALCDVCDKKLFDSDCPHVPGRTHAMSEDEIETQRKRGVPTGACTYTLEDVHFSEVSVVYDGAIPNAGTAFSSQTPLFETPSAPAPTPAPLAAAPLPAAPPTQTPAPEPALSEDIMKYSAEAKIAIGLAATATDLEYEARCKELQAFATENATLKAGQKKTADDAFAAKWTEILGADVVADLVPLTNRDTVAEKFSAKVATSAAPTPAAPPIGDPLRGSGLQAAPSLQPGNLGPTPESEAWRTGLGVFATDEELTAKALTPPLKALAGVLGVKNLTPGATHQQLDAQTIASRKQMYGIA